MSKHRECRTCGGRWSIVDASQCPFCRLNEYRQEVATLQKDNDSLKAEVERFRPVYDAAIKWRDNQVITHKSQWEQGLIDALNHKEEP